MNIAGTEFNLNRGAYEVYVSGCTLGCVGCHNEALQDFNYGATSLSQIKKILKQVGNPIVKELWILGGEPQDQDMLHLQAFMSIFNNMSIKKILFTGYNTIDASLLKYFDYVKLGAFWKDSEAYVEPVLGLTLASKNQHVKKVEGISDRWISYNSFERSRFGRIDVGDES